MFVFRRDTPLSALLMPCRYAPRRRLFAAPEIDMPPRYYIVIADAFAADDAAEGLRVFFASPDARAYATPRFFHLRPLLIRCFFCVIAARGQDMALRH